MISGSLPERRSRFLRKVRNFFYERGYHEVDTPHLAFEAIPESTIELFRSERRSASGAVAETLYLLPSPELWMKQLLAETGDKLFQLGHVFRNGEQEGRLHHPEFTLLEWYLPEADYEKNIEEIRLLLESLATPESPRYLTLPFRVWTVRDVFEDFLGIVLEDHESPESLKEAALRKGAVPDSLKSWEDLFHFLLVHYIEERLPGDRPLVLKDYPASVATTACTRDGSFWSERWELYLKGVETANCYTEEWRADKIRNFCRKEFLLLKDEERKAQAESFTKNFSENFQENFPPCSGVALGFDRLFMLFEGRDSLDEVIFFPHWRGKGFEVKKGNLSDKEQRSAPERKKSKGKELPVKPAEKKQFFSR